jgi:hypothetical protein
MLSNFRAQESIEHPGEVTIFAEDENRRTVFGVVARDALADVWQTKMLDHAVTKRLVETQLDKFAGVLSAKYGRQPESFEASHRNPHQFGTVLTAADFEASGETFPMSELHDAEEYCLSRSSPRAE